MIKAALLSVLAGFVMFGAVDALAQQEIGDGPYPTPVYSCSDGVVATPLRTFSVAYRPFPEPYALFGALLAETAEERLTALGYTHAARSDADIVLTIRYAHARVSRTEKHEHYAFMLIGTCPFVSGNYFNTPEELAVLLERYVNGDIASAPETLVPHDTHSQE